MTKRSSLIARHFLAIDADDPADAVRRIDDEFAGLEIGLHGRLLHGDDGFCRLGGHNRRSRLGDHRGRLGDGGGGCLRGAGHDRLGLGGSRLGLGGSRSRLGRDGGRLPGGSGLGRRRLRGGGLGGLLGLGGGGFCRRGLARWRPASAPQPARCLTGTGGLSGLRGRRLLGFGLGHHEPICAFLLGTGRSDLASTSQRTPTRPGRAGPAWVSDLGRSCAWKGGGFAQKRLITPTTWSNIAQKQEISMVYRAHGKPFQQSSPAFGPVRDPKARGCAQSCDF